MSLIKLPSNSAEPGGQWLPRPHQQAGWDYLMNGGSRLVEVDHRRAGKDELALAWAAVAMHQEKPISVWHMLPEASQARKAIWNALDAARGKRRIDLAFPKELRRTTREQDMFIEFHNGSTWQVVGSDNFDSLVGSQPSGIVFSEFALANPYSWSYLRPILLENGGWAIFISTPRGRNHLNRLYRLGLEDNDWLSVFNPADATDVFTEQQLEAEHREYIATYGDTMGEALFKQEYMCSWSAAVPGAYWGTDLDRLETDGRLTDVPHDPEIPVTVSYDLGVNDYNVALYWQQAGAQIRLIDYDVRSGVGIPTFMEDQRSRPQYNILQNTLPFDVKVRELGTDGKSRKAMFLKNGAKNIRVAPGPGSMSRQDGIDAFRRMIPRLWIDKDKCSDVFEAWKGYHADWDDKTQTLAKAPKHDWTSNYADSARYFAITPVRHDDWGNLDYSDLNRAAG